MEREARGKLVGNAGGRRRPRIRRIAAVFVVALILGGAAGVLSSCSKTAATAGSSGPASVSAGGARSGTAAGGPSGKTNASVANGGSATTSVGGGVNRAGGGSGEVAALPPSLPANAVPVHVPILMYHYVADTPPPAGPYANSLTVRTKDFEAELSYLRAHSYHAVSLADVYLAMAGRKRLPPEPVVLTFDDGGLDNYQVAFPLLKRFGMSATFFVITGAVGGPGQMDWQELKEMAAQGMSIESHTVSHPDLRRLSPTRLQFELVGSRDAITQEIGVPAYAVAYPSGAYDARVIQATRAAGYLMGIATDKGKEGIPSSIFEMRRRRVMAFLSLRGFANIVR